jgi:uncharacterized membrane protein YdjX (TVP38/TMEM64 family)
MPILRMSDDPVMFREYMQKTGLMGILAYETAVILQVIAAIIPGGPFQIAAGYAFGTVKGALICSVGTTLGSLIVLLFVRIFGIQFIELFYSKEKIESVRFLKSSEGKEFILFILFLIPGTPKDLLSYVVGLTDIKIVHWILITFFGRMPAIMMSTYSGSAIVHRNYGRFIAIMAAVTLAALAGGAMYLWWSRRRNEKEEGRKDGK